MFPLSLLQMSFYWRCWQISSNFRLFLMLALYWTMADVFCSLNTNMKIITSRYNKYFENYQDSQFSPVFKLLKNEALFLILLKIFAMFLGIWTWSSLCLLILVVFVYWLITKVTPCLPWRSRDRKRPANKLYSYLLVKLSMSSSRQDNCYHEY